MATTSLTAAGARSLPPGIFGTVLFGFVVIVALVAAAVVWGGSSQLASAVVAQGFVTVDSYRKAVQHVDGGAIKAILVRDGDRVEANQPLIMLDDANPRANYRILKSGYSALLATEARLLAEQNHEQDVVFPELLLSQAGDPKLAELMDGQRGLLQVRRVALAGESEILLGRVSQLDEEILGLHAQVKAKTQQVSLIQRELSGLRSLYDQGLAAISRVLALEREEARLEGERGELTATIARAKKAIGETKLQILQLDRKFREQVANELREIQPRLIDIAERVSAADNALKRITIHAPVAGTVVNMTVHNTDAVITAGQTVAEIVPEGDELVIEAKIQPAHTDHLVVGQEADIRILAFNQRTTPPLKGRYSYLSADRIIDTRTGEVYFKARISVPLDQLAVLGDKHLIPGMPAEVIIKTGSRTALDYILEPILVSFDKAWRER
jgi:HlyD family type I secretion membrane fusion protein